MDVWWFLTIVHVMILNHPTEITVKRWLFRAPGMYVFLPQLFVFRSITCLNVHLCWNSQHHLVIKISASKTTPNFRTKQHTLSILTPQSTGYFQDLYTPASCRFRAQLILRVSKFKQHFWDLSNLNNRFFYVKSKQHFWNLRVSKTRFLIVLPAVTWIDKPNGSVTEITPEKVTNKTTQRVTTGWTWLW